MLPVVLWLAVAHAGLAQDATSDDFGGLRGTVDATGTQPAFPGFGAPASAEAGNGSPAAAAPNVARLAPSQRLRLQALRNGALPGRTPVGLADLQAYPRSARLKGGQLADGVPSTAVAALPIESRRVLTIDPDPYGPVGYPVGSVRVFPYFQQSLGYDTNPEQVATGVKGSAYSRTEAGLTLQSNWTASDLHGTMYGAYDDFFQNHNADRPDANGVVDWVVHATNTTNIDTEARFNIDTQRPGSPELNFSVAGRPLIEAFGGTLGVTQGFGRFSVGLHGLVDRTTYDNGVLTNGDPVDLAYQNVTDYGTKLRVGYDLKPGLQPFVEFGVDERIHDDTVDISGYRRDSDGVAARLGSSFELLSQMLTGTVSAGYAARFYDDPRLENLTGPTADVSVAWAVTPLTTVTANAATSFNETTVIGSPGIESRTVGVTLTHALFRNLTLSGALIYQNNSYEGVAIDENVLTESLKADYHLSRSVVLTGTLSHQQLTSTVAGYDYTQSVALLGLRFQH